MQQPQWNQGGARWQQGGYPQQQLGQPYPQQQGYLQPGAFPPPPPGQFPINRPPRQSNPMGKIRVYLDGAEAPPRSPVLRAVLKKTFRARLLGFAALGVVLGFLGFWGLPLALDGLFAMDSALPAAKVSIFTFWMFINIHHYLIDNVIWRRQNPEARRFLFGDTRPAPKAA